MSRWAREQQHNGYPLKIHCLDVKKAYFNGQPTRSMYIRLPHELGLGRNMVGRLKRCIYGTRDAGAIWEQCYTKALLDIGFKQGVSSPCCFLHEGGASPWFATAMTSLP